METIVECKIQESVTDEDVASPVIITGHRKFMCLICGYVYDEETGDPTAGAAPGTRWENLPDGWVCPECGAPKDDFEEISDT